MSTTLTAAAAELGRALDASRETDRALVHAALRALCLRVLDEQPTASTIVLEWSDQGAWLIVTDVLDPAGASLDWYDEAGIAVNLEGHTESIWKLFMEWPYEELVCQPTNIFHLSIASTITRIEAEEL